MQKSTNNSRNVLDHGFVRLIDCLGDDRRIVQAARVSYGSGLKGDEKDKRLIDYLYRNDHGTPFEKVVFEFHVKLPIFVARQWMRHRMGSFNEISGRYTLFNEKEFYVPDQFRQPDSKNKQGSKSLKDPAKDMVLDGVYRKAVHEALVAYESMLNKGVAKEVARMVLPVCMYTQFYWTVNLRSLFNFLKLRLDEKAQFEIQQYASVLHTLSRPQAPWAFESFENSLELT
jgi:thymidylate synthase (FAD)